MKMKGKEMNLRFEEIHENEIVSVSLQKSKNYLQTKVMKKMKIIKKKLKGLKRLMLIFRKW